MINAIGDTVLLGLGIAFNPIAIVTSILILTRAHAKRNGTAFALGWICGLALLVVLPAVLIQDRLSVPRDTSRGPSEAFAFFRAALGVLLLLGSLFPLRNQPLPGEPVADPRWARALDSGSVGRRFGLGAFLSTVSLRNLIFLAAAASLIGQAQLGTVSLALTAALFVAIASLGVLVPLMAHLFGGDASKVMLDGWAAWLNRNMGPITALIMVLFGVLLLTTGVQEVR